MTELHKEAREKLYPILCPLPMRASMREKPHSPLAPRFSAPLR
jgi:hypothetical protein